MKPTHSFASISDDELIRRLSDLLGQSRRNEAELVAHIGEVDRRRLFAREAAPSMFAYCTETLHLSEAEANLRIAKCDDLAGRAAAVRSAPRTRSRSMAFIVEQAVTEKLQRLEARRFAQTQAPRKALSQSDAAPTTRHMPSAVKRAVFERDEGRCRYVDEQGRRCTARQGLEFHHRHPFGYGGDHSVPNIALMCRRHNGYLAELDYGREPSRGTAAQ
jgi:hypothetical protein